MFVYCVLYENSRSRRLENPNDRHQLEAGIDAPWDEKKGKTKMKKTQNQFCPRVPKDALECMVASNPSVLGFGLLNQAPISAIP